MFLSFVVACVLVLRCCECVCAVCDFGSKVRSRTFGCVAMGSAVLFIMYILMDYYYTYLYSALFKLCSNALHKNTVIPLLNTYLCYTEKK